MSDQIEKLMAQLDVSRKGAEKIAEILRAGTNILLEEGFTALTKRRIAKRLGIGHGNVSYYFPTRESLWDAVVDHELKAYYKHHMSSKRVHHDDPQASFDELVVGWIDEYNDPRVRMFFSHILAFAEVNDAVAEIRDEIYEQFFSELFGRAKALEVGVDSAELERRVLEIMVMLEGLHAVSAFRPEVIERNYEFRRRLLSRANAIIHGH